MITLNLKFIITIDYFEKYPLITFFAFPDDFLTSRKQLGLKKFLLIIVKFSSAIFELAIFNTIFNAVFSIFSLSAEIF